MTVCFVTNGPIEWASARYRAYWVAEQMDDAAVVEGKKVVQLPEADNYVFAKSINVAAVEELKRQGKRVFWDVCDPMHWFSPQSARRMCELADGVVASNEGLANDLSEWAGRDVITIPDRLKVEHYNRQRQHEGVDPVRFIWFGSAQNRETLLPAYIVLERLAANGYNVELTVMDDKPNLDMRYGPSCPVYMTKWALRNEVETLANHDIAILPPYPGEWGDVKSNNKHLTAWACGLPVVDGLDFIETVMMMDWHRRQEQADNGLKIVRDLYDIRLSSEEWGQILCKS
jgi:hypothetical protein